MSRWTVLAIERLGAPDAAWPSIFGPAAVGSDAIAANGLHTLDLTPFLAPVSDLAQQMERDLTTTSFSSVKLDLRDTLGTLADELGPFSTTMAATNRYFGPWVQLIETWGTSDSAVRFLGYLDETSLQWSEEGARTQATAIHASQLLKERLITDYPAMLRPWPNVPTGLASQDFLQGTADSMLHAAEPGYTMRSTAVALEAALWAQGQLSWLARVAAITNILTLPGLAGLTKVTPTTQPPPDAPAMSIIIGGTTFAVDHIAWDFTCSYLDAVVSGDLEIQTTWTVARVYLQGAPNLTGLLNLGDTVIWGIDETRRTHYLLPGGSITAPPSGSDGARSILLNTVDELTPGDVLTLTFSDATSGVPRLVTADLPPIIDLDGETGTVYFATALTQGYTNISKVRRNSQDPVLFDGLAYAQALCAPYALDASAFATAPTAYPVLAWQPYNQATPPLYGVHSLQTMAEEVLVASRRGAADSGLTYPTAGIWQRSSAGVWSWLGATSADATHLIYGDILQWPGSSNPYTAPVIYCEGDLSGGATIPTNGWRPRWRTLASWDEFSQPPESTWNGSAVVWSPHAVVGDVPAKCVAFCASTATPGRYTRLADGTWTFNAHTADATLGSDTTPILTGTYPSGYTLALGMGVYASGDEQEALLALVGTDSSFPFSAIQACLLSQASGGDLTVQQTASLWSTGSIPAGPWALGGGLAVQIFSETIDGLLYPHTKLHKLNGSTVTTVSLETLEVISQTIQPLHLVGAEGTKTISGWYALALETFMDANFAAARRLRFLHLDAGLNVVNGAAEEDPAAMGSLAAYFSRGELASSLMPEGSILAQMFRTSKTSDDMQGLAGGRLFKVASSLPLTVERLKLNASAPGGGLTVANSGDGMSVGDYLEKFSSVQLASAVPAADGSMALISRSAGTIRTRTFGTQKSSVQPSERGKRTKTQVWQGYLRKVRITYTDLLANGTASVEVAGTFTGGKVLEEDLSDLVCSPTMARAIGAARVYWFGPPSPILAEVWTDRTAGVAGTLNPTWWATWQMGDRVILDLYTPGEQVTAWKLLKLKPGLEARTVEVELRQQPFTIAGP